jgi:hypothetical protein
MAVDEEARKRVVDQPKNPQNSCSAERRRNVPGEFNHSQEMLLNFRYSLIA